MLYNNKFSSIIRTSKDKYYRFYINETKNLIAEEYNSAGLISNNVVSGLVLDYSVDIDEHDNIHTIFLSTDGDLKYSIYPGNHESKILTHFDMRNNNVNFLSLKLLLSDIHIFYMVGHKSNPFQLTIYHYMWHDTKWTSQKIFDITSPKYPYPFFIECDSKNNLYVFASKNCKDIYSIKKYSTEFNIWVEFERNLTIEAASNSSFFITDKDIGIISYNQSVNKNIQTFIQYKDLTKLNSSWSYPVLISNTNSIRPSVFTKNNYIYMMWEEGLNIVHRKTADIALNWGEKKVLTIKDDHILSSVYRSNNTIDSTFKSSYIFMTIKNYPCPIIDIENQHPNPNKVIHPHNNNNNNNNSNSNSNNFNKIPTKLAFSNPFENNTLENNNVIHNKQHFDEILTRTIYNKSNERNESNENNSLDDFQTLLSDKDKKIQKLNKVTSNLSEQLNILSKQYYSKDLVIQKLTSELNESNNNNSLDDFQTLLSEKDKKIGDLNNVTVSLSEQLNSMNKQYLSKELLIQKLTSELNASNDNSSLDTLQTLLSDKDKKIGDLNDVTSSLSEQLNNINKQHASDVCEYNKIIENSKQELISNAEILKKLDENKSKGFFKFLNFFN